MIDINKTVDEAFTSSMHYKCWEKIEGESGKAFAAFCVFRDMEPADRSIKNAYEISPNKESGYKQWCNWSWKFKWTERADANDRNKELIKQTNFRKKIEAQTDMQIELIGEIYDVLGRKLKTMQPEEITANHIPVMFSTATKWHREIGGLTTENKPEMKQGELSFFSEFEGL